MNIIEIKNLDVGYRRGYKISYALKNINISIKSGEYVCIIGNNGSGKSTLIKSILGLVSPCGGLISLNCKKEDLSYLPQIGTLPIDFPATIFEIVLSGTQKASKIIPFYKSKDFDSAKKAIEEVGLSGLESRLFGELSGGQQQRVLLARAICKRPKLLILDEPCNGLDTTISEAFYNILQKLNKSVGTTILMVSHDISQAEKYADKIIKLNKALIFCGSKSNWQKVKIGGEKDDIS